MNPEKEVIYRLIAALPEESLPELLLFLEFLAWKAAQSVVELSEEESREIDEALEEIKDPANLIDHSEVLKMQKEWLTK